MRSSAPLLLIGLLTGIIAVLVIGDIVESDKKFEEANKAELVQLRNDLNQLKVLVADLQSVRAQAAHTNEMLVRPDQTASLERTTGYTQQKKSGTEPQTDVIHAEKVDVAIGDYSTALDKFAEKMMSGDSYDPIESVKQDFDSQLVEANWAFEYEMNLTDLFLTDKALSQFNLRDVSCKSTLCEVTVDADQPSYIVGAELAKALAGQDWRDKEASFIFNNNSEDGSITFYLGKDKQSLQF